MRFSYSFCESVHAGPETLWHIRRLSDAGQKLGGGIDTPFLCYRGTQSRGWDLDVQITDHHLGHCCPRCADVYRQEVPK